MPRYSITKGPRFSQLAGIVEARHPDEAAKLAGVRFFLTAIGWSASRGRRAKAACFGRPGPRRAARWSPAHAFSWSGRASPLRRRRRKRLLLG